ncbi:hypothetical protein OAV88_00365 [bacterium]|nr:hypothetical protein [bacterium]
MRRPLSRFHQQTSHLSTNALSLSLCYVDEKSILAMSDFFS